MARAVDPGSAEIPELPRREPYRTWLGSLVVFAVIVLLVGSRHLITRGIPAVHQMAPFPGAWSFLRAFASGWNQAGLGSVDGARLPGRDELLRLLLGGLRVGEDQHGVLRLGVDGPVAVRVGGEHPAGAAHVVRLADRVQ